MSENKTKEADDNDKGKSYYSHGKGENKSLRLF